MKNENNLAILNSGLAPDSLFFDNLKWLTTEEAATYLRVSVGSVKNLVYRGVLRPRKLGRLNRFKKNELDRLLESSF